MPQRYRLHSFLQDATQPVALRPESFERREPANGEIELELGALSLNFRDLMIIRGHYNPKLPLPATPISDGAGTVSAVGPGVQDFKVGDRVMTNFASNWQDGPFDASYLQHTLGTPGPGMATQYQYLPHHALLKIPDGLAFADAATLPIAGLTAYSALVTEGQCRPGQRVLTLGTGGVSLFVLALAQRLGLEVAITSSSDEKLERCKALGATFTVNYKKNPAWGKAVAQWADGRGVDLVVETGGAQTLASSIRATRAGGRIAILGALTGVRGEIDLAPIMMRRISLHGVMVDCRARLQELLALWCAGDSSTLQAPIAKRFPFSQLNEALNALASAEHMGKIVVEFE